MPDAEIIPLGTRGRPGRGAGRSRPSADTRRLAGAQPAPQPEPPPAREEAGEIRTPPDDGSAGSPRGGPLPGWFTEDRLASLIAFVRRRVTGDYAVDEFGFDPALTEQILLEMVRPLAERWFRVELRGVENIPTAGGALLVSNHSGTIPLDTLVTMFEVRENAGRFLRPLGADIVFSAPFVGVLARKCGATLACSEDAERLLARGELVGVWPEGYKGIGKPFSERYRLQRFGRGGFVASALAAQAPIVPVSVVGAEETYPMIGDVTPLARLLGLPYLPVTPLFPALGPLGLLPLPSKWIIEFGEPIRTDAYLPGAVDDPMLVFDLTDQVRETIQQTLFTLLQERGSVFG